MPPQDANPTPSFGGFGLKVSPNHELHEGEMKDAWIMEVDRGDWDARR